MQNSDSEPRNALPDWPAASTVVRLILGVLFTMAGYWKVFMLTPRAHAEQFFLGWFGDSFIPHWLLWALGLSIPLLELAAGVLLLLGWRLRATLCFLGGLLVLTTYGHALREPLFNIDGHTFTRLALIVFLLLAPSDSHRYGLDHWLARRRQGLREAEAKPSTKTRPGSSGVDV